MINHCRRNTEKCLFSTMKKGQWKSVVADDATKWLGVSSETNWEQDYACPVLLVVFPFPFTTTVLFPFPLTVTWNVFFSWKEFFRIIFSKRNMKLTMVVACIFLMRLPREDNGVWGATGMLSKCLRYFGIHLKYLSVKLYRIVFESIPSSAISNSLLNNSLTLAIKKIELSASILLFRGAVQQNGLNK